MEVVIIFRDYLNKNTNEMEKLDSITILLTNVVEFLSTFAEDLSDKVDMLEMKIDKVDEKISNIKLPTTSSSNLPPPPPLVKPTVPEKPRIENLRGKIMDELKEQLKRIKERSEEEE